MVRVIICAGLNRAVCGNFTRIRQYRFADFIWHGDIGLDCCGRDSSYRIRLYKNAEERSVDTS